MLSYNGCKSCVRVSEVNEGHGTRSSLFFSCVWTASVGSAWAWRGNKNFVFKNQPRWWWFSQKPCAVEGVWGWREMQVEAPCSYEHSLEKWEDFNHSQGEVGFRKKKKELKQCSPWNHRSTRKIWILYHRFVCSEMRFRNSLFSSYSIPHWTCPPLRTLFFALGMQSRR